MGAYYKITNDNLKEVVLKIIKTSENTLEIMGKNGAEYIHKQNRIFLDKIHTIFKDVFNKTKTIKFDRSIINEDELPQLSIITPVRGFKHIFKVSILNYRSTRYPKDKLEWIIVDDSHEGEDVEELLPSIENRDKFNIKYIKIEDTMTEGEKLNIGVNNSKGDVVLIMNQHDFFYEMGMLTLVKSLLKSKKECVGMTMLGCFDINRYISIISLEPTTKEYHNRIYTGSLCFKKEKWDKNPFSDTHEPLDLFLSHDWSQFKEIYWENILVGLIHRGNNDVRVIDERQEPNGNHFKFSKKVFEYLCGLDKDTGDKSKQNESSDDKNELNKSDKSVNNNRPNIKEI